MCGIIGYIGNENFDKNAINLLLFWNSQERGKDSTGVYTPKTGILKSVAEAKIFLNSEKAKQIVPDTLLIGHVRQRSVGLATELNSHPFKQGKIIGCHNGTLLNKNSFASFYGIDGMKFDVDSDLLMKLLDDTRFSDPAEYAVLEIIDGSAAMLWHDEKTDCLNFFTNGDRPLFYGYNGVGYYISSIKEILGSIGCSNVVDCEKNMLYTINRIDLSLNKIQVVYSRVYLDYLEEIKNAEIERIKKEKDRIKYYFNCVPFTIKCIKSFDNLSPLLNISKKQGTANIKYIVKDHYYLVVGKIFSKKYGNLYVVQTDPMEEWKTYCLVFANGIYFDENTASTKVRAGNEVYSFSSNDKLTCIEKGTTITRHLFRDDKYICVSDPWYKVPDKTIEYIDVRRISPSNGKVEAHVFEMSLSQFYIKDSSHIINIEDLEEYNTDLMKNRGTENSIGYPNSSNIIGDLNSEDNDNDSCSEFSNVPALIPIIVETEEERDKKYIARIIQNIKNMEGIMFSTDITYRKLGNNTSSFIGLEIIALDKAIIEFKDSLEHLKQVYWD